ncbi:PadR family transcriptional regulator [Bifidobacterium aemilianum]|uniref:PadR family transcriptional regulator n=1 Tax=Bifidobacterium aemilianum TaxID=2493120 RepID=A0A366KD57_9BIFI|nr:PadR family transcriptional regulator [Bifidobacterium aemilianum]RBP98601.1 PadR family transcriptional regulator [Bifidobacterium aemilianum]
MSLIEMMMLGFLSEKSLCGYELRKKMEQLQGYTRTFSDGAIYPAAQRLVSAGLVEENKDVHDGRQRRLFTLMPAGRQHLIATLTDADGFLISDMNRWMVVLSFLSLVPDQADQETVLRRRYDYLSRADLHLFFCDAGHGLDGDELDDPYRRGLMQVHESQVEAELAWLREQLHIER